MNMDACIKRINELYHKSKAEGLTEEEKAEQRLLRQKYLDSIRSNIKGQLESITIQNPDGTTINVKQQHDQKKAEGKHTS